jgi:hypothetical protein
MRTGTLAAVAALLLVSAAASADYQFSGAVQVRELQKRTLSDIAHTNGSLVAVGERGLIIVSRDGGLSWTQASVPVSATLTAVDFATDEKGWAVGHAGTILHSSDGGATWQLQFDGNEANRQWLAHTTAKKESLQSQVDKLTANGDPDSLLADLEFDGNEANRQWLAHTTAKKESLQPQVDEPRRPAAGRALYERRRRLGGRRLRHGIPHHRRRRELAAAQRRHRQPGPLPLLQRGRRRAGQPVP